jgi:hypothetical protein
MILAECHMQVGCEKAPERELFTNFTQELPIELPEETRNGERVPSQEIL